MLTNLFGPKLPKIILAFTFFIVAGCSKTTETEIITQKDIKLNIQVLGITDIKSNQSVKSKAKNGDQYVYSKAESISEKIISFQSFDTQVSLKKGNLDQKNSVIESRMTGKGATASFKSTALESGITYRLLIYKEDGSFVSSTLLSSEIAGEIALNRGETYHWHAVSYHNSDPIPDLDSDNPELDVPANTDLLYASGSIEIPAQAPDNIVSLGIVFEHKYARIALELNSMGMFGDMNNVGLSISGVSGARSRINLRDGSLSNISSDPITIGFDDFVNVDPLYADRKIAYIYTAVEAPIDIDVSINALNIQLVNGENRIFSNLVEAPAVFEFSFTPQIGASYTATMNFIESFLVVNTTRFARTNLYYHGGHNPYRFLPTNEHTNMRNTYFAFRGVLPGEYGNSLTSGDPCALVYPEGIWRTPGFNQFAMITPIFPTETFKIENGLGYVEYEDTEGAGAPYPSDKLRFNMNGYGTVTNDAVNGEIEINLNATYGNTTNLWTTSSDGFNGLGVFYYQAMPTSGDETKKELIDYQGTGYVQTTFKNIRCVRAR